METEIPKPQEYYSDDDVRVLVHDVEGITFLHCYVYHMAPSVMKKLKKLLEEIKEQARSKGFKSLACITPSPKFAKILGGESLLEQDGLEVFRWALV